ncbi:MAG: hypothetical protein M1380_09575 [Chloroflexi bacterium]|nr:hypothetical protein [Chloroflexota bacterium]MCL5735666.1 hypothetical protein [Actinomycetota bacterium]
MPSQTVKVELIGVVRDLVRERIVEVDLRDRTHVSYRDVLDSLVERYGPGLRERLYGPRGLLSIVKVYGGGKLIENLDDCVSVTDGPLVRIIVFAAAGGG